MSNIPPPDNITPPRTPSIPASSSLSGFELPTTSDRLSQNLPNIIVNDIPLESDFDEELSDVPDPTKLQQKIPRATHPSKHSHSTETSVPTHIEDEDEDEDDISSAEDSDHAPTTSRYTLNISGRRPRSSFTTAPTFQYKVVFCGNGLAGNAAGAMPHTPQHQENPGKSSIIKRLVLQHKLQYPHLSATPSLPSPHPDSASNIIDPNSFTFPPKTMGVDITTIKHANNSVFFESQQLDIPSTPTGAGNSPSFPRSTSYSTQSQHSSNSQILRDDTGSATNVNISVNLWDFPATNNNQKALISTILRNATVAVVCFDFSKSQSLYELLNLVQTIQQQHSTTANTSSGGNLTVSSSEKPEKLFTIVVVTKCDQHTISPGEYTSQLDDFMKMFETTTRQTILPVSAATGENIDILLKQIMTLLMTIHEHTTGVNNNDIENDSAVEIHNNNPFSQPQSRLSRGISVSSQGSNIPRINAAIQMFGEEACGDDITEKKQKNNNDESGNEQNHHEEGINGPTCIDQVCNVM